MDYMNFKAHVLGRYLPRKSLAYLKHAYTVLASRHFASTQYIPAGHGSSCLVVPKELPADQPMAEDGLPLPPPHLLEGYRPKGDFIPQGQLHMGKFLDLAKADGASLGPGSRFLDFGCGSGRLTRHLRRYAEAGEVWGVDVRAEHISWCNQALSPPLHFATTTLIPHLPFEDRYFDLITAGSVFSHIDDMADAWLLELKRILAPGGRLVLTIHDNNTIQILDGPDKDDYFAKLLSGYAPYQQAKHTAGMISVERGLYSQVFYDLDFFREKASSIFEVGSITPGAYGRQTALVLRRPQPRGQ
jgi:SAM-dependent methyltransferase